MITLHVLEQSRAYRIAWLLELLGLEYHAERYARDPLSKLAPPQLREIHPLGKSPLLQDGETVLGESGAIVEYLIGRYGQGRLKPAADSASYNDYLFWLHYAEGSLMPLLLLSLVLRGIEAKPMPFFAKPIARKITAGVETGFLHPQLKLHLAFVNDKLEGRDWFLGTEISAADVMMSFPLQVAASRSQLPMPNIRAYVERISRDPHYRQAESKLGPLSIL